MAPTLAQSVTITGSTSSPSSLAFGSTPTAGNVVLEGYYSLGGSLAPSCSTNGNAATTVAAYNSISSSVTAAFVKLFGGTDNATFNVNDPGGISLARQYLQEWSGLTTTLDDTVKTSASPSSTTSLALGSITTTAPNSLIFVVVGFNVNNGATFSVDNGFTSVVNQRMSIAYKVQATAATVSPTASWLSASRGQAIMFALKAQTGITPAQAAAGFMPLL